MSVSLVAALMAVLGLSVVVAQDDTTPSATRTFSSPTVAPGGEVVVTIRYANLGSFGSVTETLPAGFTYVSSSLSGNSAREGVTPQERKFTLFGGSSFTYTVTAPDMAGPYAFSGTLTNIPVEGANTTHTVGGPDSVTVEAVAEATATEAPPTDTPAPGEPSATRSFDMASVDTGGEVVVTIRYANLGSFRLGD